MNRATQSFTYAKQWLSNYGPSVLGYCLATLFTQAHFTADAPDYVESIVSYDRGQYYEFWEFGHILWRPTGWVLMRSLRPLLLNLSGGDLEAGTMLLLTAVAWLAGLISVVALTALLSRFCGRRWIVSITVLTFILSHGILNFAQAGTSYMTSLCFMLLALYVLLKPKGERLTTTQGIGAGVLLALMLCCWLPFLFIVPVVLIAPLAVSAFEMKKVKPLFVALVVAGVLTASVYLVVVAGPVGVRSVSGFRAWMRQTTASTSEDKGVARTILGFPRSFIYFGNDGMLFKRYLVRDPFNPVTAWDLVRLSLWKLILFYLFLAALVINLWRSEPGRWLLVPLGLAAVAVLGVAVYWHGGDIERYLPLYPILFLSVGSVLCNKQSWRVLNYVVLIFLTAAAVTNLYAMSLPVQGARQANVSSRISGLEPRLKPASRIFVVDFQDELYSFSRDFPFNPIVRAHTLQVAGVVEVSGKDAPRWRQNFAARAESIWSGGGDVWISRRLLSSKPKAEWNWVEGDDVRLSWADFYQFFSQLEVGDVAGGDDGFVLVLPSDRTRQTFNRFNSQ
jgi:hypothetical protein